MAKKSPNRSELKRITALVAHFEGNRELVSRFLEQVKVALVESNALAPHVHSIRWRVKDPVHLKGKLVRKLMEAKTQESTFGITEDNLFVKVNDLAGIRLLHLYTEQFALIDSALRNIFEEQQYNLVEGPFAKTWDDESRKFFRSCGISTQESPSMYTSVHYIIESASRTKITCEIQVRTLMEEVWGEVDHTINYPDQIGSVACKEQIKVLARVTSSATRLVDSIFRSLEDYRAHGSTHGVQGAQKHLGTRKKRLPAKISARRRGKAS